MCEPWLSQSYLDVVSIQIYNEKLSAFREKLSVAALKDVIARTDHRRQWYKFVQVHFCKVSIESKTTNMPATQNCLTKKVHDWRAFYQIMIRFFPEFNIFSFSLESCLLYHSKWVINVNTLQNAIQNINFDAFLRVLIALRRTFSWGSLTLRRLRCVTADYRLTCSFWPKMSLRCQLPNRNVFCCYHQRKVRNTPAHWFEGSMLGWDRPHYFLTHHEHHWLITQICRNSNVKQPFSGIWTSADCNSRNVPICLKLFQQW